MTKKARAYAPPLLWDGLPLAIKNIRARKGLSQAQAAERGDTTAETWSQWETRTKRLLRVHLPNITKGLEVTEFELHWESKRLEEEHYKRQAAEIGEPRPTYDTSVTSGIIGSLPQGRGELPVEVENWQNQLTNASATVVASAMTLADCIKGGPPTLKQAWSSKIAEEEAEDRTRESPEEEPTDR